MNFRVLIPFQVGCKVVAVMKYMRLAAVLAMFLLVTGCAATSTFTAYPNNIKPLISSLANRTPLDLSQCLVSECKSNDLILYNMERGRFAHVVGSNDSSMSDFKASIEKIGQNDEKALISASAIGANVSATLLNDNAIPYAGEGYERVLLHHYQALNYLRKKDLDGAGVEVRRANAAQIDSLKRFEKDIEKARQEASKKKVNTGGISRIDAQYAQMDEVAGSVKNSFQNAYTYYVSALVYELLQQPDDAYIDYKKALEIYPDNRYVRKDVIRLAEKLEMREDLEELKRRFPAEKQEIIPVGSAATGELLVLFEDGLVPQKQEVKIPLPIVGVGLVTVAFPIYREKWSAQIPLRILGNNVFIGYTEPICDIRALAVRALKERVPEIAVRQIIRATAKGVMAVEARRMGGELGLLTASLWNYISENADLRSWLTLPSNAQILRAAVPPGSYRLALQHPMASAITYLDVEVPAGGKTVVQVVRTGQQMYSSVTSFSR